MKHLNTQAPHLEAGFNIPNPDPQMPPFLQQAINDLYNWAAGAGLGLSGVAIIAIAVALMFAKWTGGVGRLVGGLVAVIAAAILIINAGAFLNLWT